MDDRAGRTGLIFETADGLAQICEKRASRKLRARLTPVGDRFRRRCFFGVCADPFEDQDDFLSRRKHEVY
jgi:hypothetical protein